jgi:hypothetical protein
MNTTREAARTVAKRLLESASTVTLWTSFSDELRDALLDSAVMDAVRLAHEDSVISANKLVAFRDLIVELLAEGVFIGKSKRGLRFDRDREARREMVAYLAGKSGLPQP